MAEQRRTLIYTEQSTDLPKGYSYSNPVYFSTPRAGIARVLVHGDFPHIVDAYSNLKPPVPVEEISELPKADAGSSATLKPSNSLTGGETKVPALGKGQTLTTPTPTQPEPASGEAQLSGAVNTNGTSLTTDVPPAQAAGKPIQSAPADAKAEIAIPANFEQLGWKELRTLASQFTEEQVVNKDIAIRVVALEIQRREKLAKDAAAAAKK